MRKSVYSLILTTFLATSSFAGDQRFDDLPSLPSGSQQSTHSVVPVLGDPYTVTQTEQDSVIPKLRRRNSGNVRGGRLGTGLTRADFKDQQEEERNKPTHRRRPSGDKSGGGSGNGDRGGCAAKLVESHADFAARTKPDLKRVPSGQHGESTGKPPLKRVPSGHHGEGPVENSMENSNDFFAYVHAYRQGLPIESH